VDLKSAVGREELLALLAGADVLVTNMRVGALERLGLGYEAIAAACPHLVYCRLTAYGASGPDREEPGYDVGAFWAATGMAASVQPEGLHGVYPAGFGDITTASTLVGGVGAVLKRRLATGKGGLVDSSLLRAGLFCLAGVLCQVPAPDPSQVVPRLNRFVGSEADEASHWACADGNVAVLGEAAAAAPSSGAGASGFLPPRVGVAVVEAALRPALALAGLVAGAKTTGGGGVAALREAVSALPTARVLELLAKGGVACCEASELLNVAHYREEHVKRGKVLHKNPQGVFFTKGNGEGCDVFSRKPFHFLLGGGGGACGGSEAAAEVAAQGPKAGAAVLGAHTHDVLAAGWQPRPAGSAFPTSAEGGGGSGDLGRPLAGVVVVELSWGDGVAAAATALQLAEAGATVIKVTHALGPAGAGAASGAGRLAEQFDEQFDAGKEPHRLNLGGSGSSGGVRGTGGDDSGSLPPLVALLAAKGAHCLVTDAPASALRRCGVDPALPGCGLSAPRISSGSSSGGGGSGGNGGGGGGGGGNVSTSGLVAGLVVVVLTPWGLGGPEAPRGDLGPFWSRSGMGATVSGCIDPNRSASLTRANAYGREGGGCQLLWVLLFSSAVGKLSLLLCCACVCRLTSHSIRRVRFCDARFCDARFACALCRGRALNRRRRRPKPRAAAAGAHGRAHHLGARLRRRFVRPPPAAPPRRRQRRRGGRCGRGRVHGAGRGVERGVHGNVAGSGRAQGQALGRRAEPHPRDLAHPYLDGRDDERRGMPPAPRARLPQAPHAHHARPQSAASLLARALLGARLQGPGGHALAHAHLEARAPA